jgi:carbonic anhydrase
MFKCLKTGIKSALLARILVACAVVAVTVGAALASEHPAGVAPEDALSRLVQGNQRFVSGQAAMPDLSAARLKELTAGQHPCAAVITCADSRVAPEHLFNAGPGDLFVIRVAGKKPGDAGDAHERAARGPRRRGVNRQTPRLRHHTSAGLCRAYHG